VPFNIQAVKATFLDRAEISGAIDAGTRRALSKFGAFVRRRSRSSIRKRKKASKPGKPPSSHIGTLKNLIFFAFDPAVKSVVTGPVLSGKPSGAPETLEYSGAATIRERVKSARKARSKAQAKAYRKLVKDGRLTPSARQYTTRVIRVDARPFMNPAFQAELPKAPQMFKDQIR
jgi:hypothetical protein